MNEVKIGARHHERYDLRSGARHLCNLAVIKIGNGNVGDDIPLTKVDGSDLDPLDLLSTMDMNWVPMRWLVCYDEDYGFHNWCSHNS